MNTSAIENTAHARHCLDRAKGAKSDAPLLSVAYGVMALVHASLATQQTIQEALDEFRDFRRSQK